MKKNILTFLSLTVLVTLFANGDLVSGNYLKNSTTYSQNTQFSQLIVEYSAGEEPYQPTGYQSLAVKYELAAVSKNTLSITEFNTGDTFTLDKLQIDHKNYAKKYDSGYKEFLKIHNKKDSDLSYKEYIALLKK